MLINLKIFSLFDDCDQVDYNIANICLLGKVYGLIERLPTDYHHTFWNKFLLANPYTW